MSNWYLDCTLHNDFDLGDGTKNNPYNLHWVWNNATPNVDDEIWYIQGVVTTESPDQIMVTPHTIRGWDAATPFILDSTISDTDGFLSDLTEVRQAICNFPLASKAPAVYDSILFGGGASVLKAGEATKLYKNCTAYTSNGAPVNITFTDTDTGGTITFDNCILNGATVTGGDVTTTINTIKSAVNLTTNNYYSVGWAGIIGDETGTVFETQALPFVTLASIVSDPATEKEKVNFEELLELGYLESELVNTIDTFGPSDTSLLGGRRRGRGALWFPGKYVVNLNRAGSLGDVSADSAANSWGYIDFIKMCTGQSPAYGYHVREGDIFILEESFTWTAQILFPSYRVRTMRGGFEHIPNEVTYKPIQFRRLDPKVPVRIQSPSGLIDFGTNNMFKDLIVEQEELGADLKFNKFENCVFFHPEQIIVPADFTNEPEGAVTFTACDFVTKMIYVQGKPSGVASKYSIIFNRCCLWGFGATKVQIKADSYTDPGAAKINRVIHLGTQTIFRNGPFNFYGPFFSEAQLEFDGWCSGTVFHEGAWLGFETDAVTDQALFRGDYTFPAGLKTDVQTDFQRSGGGDPQPNTGNVEISDSFGVTGTASLVAGTDDLTVNSDTLHDPSNLARGIVQTGASEFIYNDAGITGLGNVTGTTTYNGGGPFDFSNIPSSFDQRPGQTSFDFNDPAIQAAYINWSNLKGIIGIPVWQNNVTVANLEAAYAYCLSNGHTIDGFAIIRVDSVMVPLPGGDPLEAFTNNIIFIVDAHINVQFTAFTGFWNCTPTSSINMVVRSGGQLTFGGPHFSTGLYRGFILILPGGFATMGQNIVNLRTMVGAVHDFSGGLTNWYSQEPGIDMFFDPVLMGQLEAITAFTDIGSVVEVDIDTEVFLNECYLRNDETSFNTTPDDLVLTLTNVNENTELSKDFPSTLAGFQQDDMQFDDYNNADNLIVAASTYTEDGLWGTPRVTDSVGTFASETVPVPRVYYVDVEALSLGDGTEVAPLNKQQYIEYLDGTGTYTIVSGDILYVYGSSVMTPLTVVCDDDTEVIQYSWNKNGVAPVQMGFNLVAEPSLFLFSGTPSNVNFKFYDFIFFILDPVSVTVASGALLSTIECYNCAAIGDAPFNIGIDRDEPEGTPIQNTMYWYTSTWSLSDLNTSTGRVYCNDVVLHREALPLPLSINSFNANDIDEWGSGPLPILLEILDNGSVVRMVGNSWTKTPISYTLTPHTKVIFDFKSDILGEIQGFAVTESPTYHDPTKIFNLVGSQSYAIQDYKTYVTGSGWQTFVIPIGEYYTGVVNYFTFVNDNDAMPLVGDIFFRNIRFTEFIASNELTIDGLETNIDEADITNPISITNAVWNSEAAAALPFDIVPVGEPGTPYNPSDFLWYYLGFVNGGQGGATWSSWLTPDGMEGFQRVGVGYLSFREVARNLYTDFDKVNPGDGTQGDPWTRGQFLTYFGSAGYDPIATQAERGDTVWCRGTCFVYDEGSFIPVINTEVRNITVRAWDININDVIRVDLTDSVAAVLSTLSIDNSLVEDLIVKDFFFYSLDKGLTVVESAASVGAPRSVTYTNSSWQVGDEVGFFLNRTANNDTSTTLKGCTIKTDIINVHATSNTVIIDNCAIDAEWNDLDA